MELARRKIAEFGSGLLVITDAAAEVTDLRGANHGYRLRVPKAGRGQDAVCEGELYHEARGKLEAVHG